MLIRAVDLYPEINIVFFILKNGKSLKKSNLRNKEENKL